MPMIGFSFTALFAWTYALKSINSSNIKDIRGKSIKSWKITDSSRLKMCLSNVLSLSQWQIAAEFIIKRTTLNGNTKNFELISKQDDCTTTINLGIFRSEWGYPLF